MYESDLVYKIQGSIFDIYNNVVGNWREEDYERVLFDAARDGGLNVERQKEFEVFYKGNRVGLYITDLIVESKIIIELKNVPIIFPLHEAQTISYLKVTGLRLAMLVNFGGEKLFVKIYPNKYGNNNINSIENSFSKRLAIDFNISKTNLLEKDRVLIQPFLMICKEILEILGPGFFHQVYRRSYWDELKANNINFEWISQLELSYKGRIYNRKDVKFFKINNLLVSIIAVKELDKLIIERFFKFIKYYKCDSGLIMNFNSITLDYRFIKNYKNIV